MSGRWTMAARLGRGWRLLALVLAALAATLAVLLLRGAPARSEAVPIKHVVVILQENHSFDDVLGRLCVETHRECDAVTVGRSGNGGVVPLKEATDVVTEANHAQNAQVRAIDGGKMDGWNKVTGCASDECYVQYKPSQIPSLAALARAGAISDRFFSRDIVPSWGGHVDFFAQTLDGFVGENPQHIPGAPADGPGWGCDSNLDTKWVDPVSGKMIFEPACIPDRNGNGPYRPSPVRYVPTVADRIEEAGSTWGIYGAVAPREKDRRPYKWAICPTFAECLYGPQKGHMHTAQQLFGDARAGTLPGFSILTPTAGVTGPTSQHNGTSMLAGDNFIGEEVSAIENGPDGPTTTIFIYYDDCGCFYDHAAPPAGLGVRLPLVIVSPYAKPGFTDHNLATNSSILAYMESILHVAPVDEQDATAYDLHESFDYTRAPAAPFTFRRAAVPAASQNLSPVADDDT